MDYNALARLATQRGGVTWDPRAHVIVTHGYAVATLKRNERTLQGVLLGRHLAGYVFDNAQALYRQDACLGAWLDRGVWYLDCCRVVVTPQEALALARQSGQMAFYDLHNQEVRWVDAVQASAP